MIGAESCLNQGYQAGIVPGVPIKNRKMASQLPKKPLTPYMCFLKQQKQLVMGRGQDIVMKEFVRMGAHQWNQLTEAERDPYQRMAEQDKIRHENEMELYRNGQFTESKTIDPGMFMPGAPQMLQGTLGQAAAVQAGHDPNQ